MSSCSTCNFYHPSPFVCLIQFIFIRQTVSRHTEYRPDLYWDPVSCGKRKWAESMKLYVVKGNQKVSDSGWAGPNQDLECVVCIISQGGSGTSPSWFYILDLSLVLFWGVTSSSRLTTGSGVNHFWKYSENHWSSEIGPSWPCKQGKFSNYYTMAPVSPSYYFKKRIKSNVCIPFLLKEVNTS